MDFENAMAKAIEIARAAATASGDVPVGAIILDRAGEVVSTGVNQRELMNNPIGHAEIIAIEKAASALGDWRLDGCTLVVTLEPCAMCAGAIAQSRISKVIFGAWDEKAGAVGSKWDLLRDPRQIHKPEVVSGVLREECAALLTEFFQPKRD
jgi:tRNA(adenine34) deaminase